MQKRSWSTLVSLAVLMCVGDLANAGLYPTRPVAKTIFEAGNVETVKWKDSDEKPSLEDTPRLRMDLYVNDDVFLATLAEEVNPLDLYHNVTVNPDLWGEGSSFHIRFYSKKPEMVIYTADFTITGMTGTNKSGSNNNHDSGDNSDVGLGLQASASTSNISTVTATSTMSASTGDSSTLATSFQSGQHSHSGERPTGRRFSAERGLVKYVHVLWPALIGVALAL